MSVSCLHCLRSYWINSESIFTLDGRNTDPLNGTTQESRKNVLPFSIALNCICMQSARAGQILIIPQEFIYSNSLSSWVSDILVMEWTGVWARTTDHRLVTLRKEQLQITHYKRKASKTHTTIFIQKGFDHCLSRCETYLNTNFHLLT